MAGDVGYTVDLMGSDKLIRVLLAAGPQAPQALARGLYEEAQLAFRGSQKEVPYRWGPLKGSGRLTEPKMSGSSVEVDIVYGGASAPYAAAVHELAKNYRGGKKRFYLLDPVQARVKGFDARMAKRIDRIIGEGIG